MHHIVLASIPQGEGAGKRFDWCSQHGSGPRRVQRGADIRAGDFGHRQSPEVPFAEAPPDSLTLVGVPGESSWAARWPNCGRKLMVRGRALRGLTTVHRDDAFKTAPQSHGHIVSQPLADGSARTTGPLARSWRAGCAHLSDERVYVHPSASHPWVRVGRVQAE